MSLSCGFARHRWPRGRLAGQPQRRALPFQPARCPVRAQAGLQARRTRRQNPHDLRHTYATILLMAGVCPAYVQKQLGFSSISMTVDIYGHWVPGDGRTGLEAALIRWQQRGFPADACAKTAYNCVEKRKSLTPGR
ncbi:MAG: hypothetical protein EHM37_10885 [Deltaproteobacteria bacterium]|nr:MAG: hypothetical protein EHM37_10885 [Deltaproteobacteria bacterium]